MRLSFKILKKSFGYALRGLKYTYQHEQNFRIQLVVAAIVVALMIILPVQQWEAVALFFVISFILILEILNTTLERFIDVLKPRLNHYSGVIKDMMAAMVLLASISAIIVGAIIFIPYFLSIR